MSDSCGLIHTTVFFTRQIYNEKLRNKNHDFYLRSLGEKKNKLLITGNKLTGSFLSLVTGGLRSDVGHWPLVALH